jgi:soluble lytic murein transglycosylase
MADAQQAFDWGDYPRAYQEYAALLDDPGATAEERRIAAYWAGRSAMEAGEYAGALDLFAEFIQGYPADTLAPIAHMIRARAYEGLADWRGAIGAYQAYLASGDGTLEIYAYEGMAEAAMLALDYAGAAQAFAEGVRLAPDNGWAVRMREGVAESRLAQGNPLAAVEQYDAILDVARIPAYRARILYLAGQALAAAENPEAAHERYLQAVNRYPEAYDSYLALVELVNAEVPVDDYQRGLVDYHAEVYQPAVEAFTRYLQARPGARNGETLWYLARSLKANGNLTQAIERFQELIEDYPQQAHAAEAWLEMAEAYAWREDPERARQIYRDFAEAQPDSPLAATALWQAAELELEGGRLAEAAARFREVAARYPRDEGSPEALFRAALLGYRSARYESARDDWQAIIRGYPDSRAAGAARFWLGKAWLALDEAEEAQAAFEAAREWLPDSFYGVRAAEMLAGNSAFRAMAAPVPVATQDGQAEAERWLAGWLPITDTVELHGLDPAIAESPAFRRGAGLLAAGRRSEALEEFETVQDAWWENPLAMYQLALAFRDRGLYRLSIICAERLMWLSPAGSRSQVPEFIQRLSYPLYYRELVLEEAQDQAFSPLLLFALIRQESLFEPSISSLADARGLTQIIPPTGEWIAGRLGDADFVEEDLLLPYVNISYGAWYLGVQLATFEGDIAPALAAYNAGPGRIHRWLEDTPGDLDLFVETMPFAEPRQYVRNIYENYAHYLRLYQGDF